MAMCPCCGAESAQRISPASLLDFLHLSPRERVVLNALVKHFGKDVPSQTLVDAMYQARRDGGPDSAESSFRVATHRLRGKLKPFGLTIKGHSDPKGGTTRLQAMPAK